MTSETDSALKRFRNIPSGQPFTPNNKSGGYSLQVDDGNAKMGMRNYKQWQHDQKTLLAKLMPGTTEYSFNTDWNLRTGPMMDQMSRPMILKMATKLRKSD